MKLEPAIEVDIVRAEAAGGYQLRLFFSDGHVQLVEFGPFLENSLNLETRQFLEAEQFKTYRLDNGNLVWGDYEMCFPLEDLYEGCLAGKHVLAVAEEKSEYGSPVSNAQRSTLNYQR